MTRRVWSDAERSRAVGLGLTQGADAASRATGVPRRTVSRWLASPDATIVRAETREQVAERLWSAVVEGTEAVSAGLRDPKARLSDKASALRVVLEAHALLTGGPTARTEATVTTAPALTWQEAADARHWLDTLEAATDEELAEWLANGGATMLRDTNRRAVEAKGSTDGR